MNNLARLSTQGGRNETFNNIITYRPLLWFEKNTGAMKIGGFTNGANRRAALTCLKSPKDIEPGTEPWNTSDPGGEITCPSN